MVRLAHLFFAARRRLAPENGGFLIEVVVSAALIVTAGGGVLMAMDSATKQSGEQRLMAVAADVAQGEMERLRSQKFEALTKLSPEPRPKTVAGTTYTIVSTSAWAMQSPAGAMHCTSSARSPEALRVTTAVTWPRMSRRPVTISSLVAAPAGSGAARGSFVVQVTNRDGTGLAGVSVLMAGATNVTGSTDTNGCLRFTDLVPGMYDVRFSRPGYVTPAGAASVNEPVEVVGGQSRSKSFEIDRLATATADVWFDNDPGAGTSLKRPTAHQKAYSVDHAGMTPNHKTALIPAGTHTFTTMDLYPFGSGYAIYADECTAARPPATLTPTLAPGANTTGLVLRLPVLEVRPRNAVAGDRIYVMTACGNVLGPSYVVDPGNGKKDVNYNRDGWPYATSDMSVCVVSADGRNWDVEPVTNTQFDAPTVVDTNAFNRNASTTAPAGACGGWLT